MQQIYATKNASAEYARVQRELDAYAAEKRKWRKGDKSGWRNNRCQDMLNRLDGGE